ncbi:MAG: hypothetical protein M3355_06970 [Actinomycetota bacterium]|nr:hypothetical protein [Actinomycetota bacterium]
MNDTGRVEEIPKGSYAAGRRAKLPRGAAEPIRVHINGVEQNRGEVWDVREDEIVFTRQIVKEYVSKGRWMAMYLGLFGSYQLNEQVDVEYALDGKPKLAANIEILPD